MLEKIEGVFTVSNINLSKFPCFLRTGFREHNLDFPEETGWQYEPLLVYRMVLREDEDYSNVTKRDFMSYTEKNKSPKRGMDDASSNPLYYGVSTFTDKSSLVNKMKLPRPGKKIAEGHLLQEYGPIYKDSSHVCIWFYEDADLSDNDFQVKNYE